ncbi:hypothetical protein [Chromobacterium sp. CV08]|uniref:NHL domain-containing protein n=1 Tax=Chromobacterium sp. CV08 TaxID=3133274 RepID=UPI003DA7AB2A
MRESLSRTVIALLMLFMVACGDGACRSVDRSRLAIMPIKLESGSIMHSAYRYQPGRSWITENSKHSDRMTLRPIVPRVAETFLPYQNDIHFPAAEKPAPGSLMVDASKMIAGMHSVDVQASAWGMPPVTTIAGSGIAGYRDGYSRIAQFFYPISIATDSNNNVYVADFWNHKIRKINNTTKLVTTIAGREASLYFPGGVAVNRKGDVYIADSFNNKIKKASADGSITTIAGDDAAGYLDGKGSQARFYIPMGIAVGVDGSIYVADSGNNLIRKITEDGTVTTVSGSSAGFADGSLRKAKFYYPSGVAIDAETGLIYVIDSRNNRIRKLNINNNTVSTLAGSGAVGARDGKASIASFNFYGYYTTGIVVGFDGEVYVADSYNQKIRRIDPGGNVTTLSGSTYGLEDGSAAAARYAYPTGLAMGRNGCLFVADFYNHAIRRISK